MKRKVEQRAAQHKPDTSEERHRRREYLYWWVTGAAAVAATVGTVAAAIFAYGAYEAALGSAAEAKRQADIAQRALVASTRALLKITSIENVTATKAEGIPVAWFNATATYKNFGQSPAQNIFLSLHVFVLGAGPSPTRACERDKAGTNRYSDAVVFPQGDEGSNNYGAQIALDNLKAEAAEVRAVQPEAPVYLGVIGCLTYRSASSEAVYVTGFSGSLHLADAEVADNRDYVPAYDTIVETDYSMEVRLKLNTDGAWAN